MVQKEEQSKMEKENLMLMGHCKEMIKYEVSSIFLTANRAYSLFRGGRGFQMLGSG